jgi:hypothetical protein
VRFIFPYCKRITALQAIAASTTEHLGLTTESSGRGNVVNINIKTSNESIASHPLRNLGQVTNFGEAGEVRRSRQIGSSKSYF